ncbi:MAG: alpha-L-fucosidase, partial [Lentisphaeria bacterium]|nr:alpha-L-fucosidase [Lentisphaeria bacterium]
ETPFNIMNTPYKKDIVGMLAEECHKRDFPLEIYYSCVDWHHKAYPNLGRHHEIETDPKYHNMDEYMAFLKNQIRELCSNYGAIHGIWWDMNVPGHMDESVHDLIRSLQPCAVINNRGYGKGDYSTPERSPQEDSYLPFTNPVEACDSISMNSWGYRKDDDYFSLNKLKRQIAFYTGLGGNFLLNAGPGPDGLFPAEAEKILGSIGKWHGKVKEALNAPACPGVVENREILCTGGGRELYLILLDTPVGTSIRLKGLDKMPVKAEYLTTGKQIPFTLERVPYTLLQPPALRLRSLPVEEMYGELPVIKLTFDDDVIHPVFPGEENINNSGILKDE